ncbi:hypothetical protein [Streptomyces olivochromogenes]|uniref:hypothetical protein n=1 Tax=Streptomyces olivochromogenes TaxID=1963 RepID=UPI0035AD86C3
MDDFGGFARNIIASPNVIAPGGRLGIMVQGCQGGGTASSQAFRSPSLSGVNGGNDQSSGFATVNRDARPGRYDITVNCNGRTLTSPGAFTVMGGVLGGLGGSSSTGATKTDMAIGGGLVASSVIGGGVFLLRRRQERRI